MQPEQKRRFGHAGLLIPASRIADILHKLFERFETDHENAVLDSGWQLRTGTPSLTEAILDIPE